MTPVRERPSGRPSIGLAALALALALAGCAMSRTAPEPDAGVEPDAGEPDAGCLVLSPGTDRTEPVELEARIHAATLFLLVERTGSTWDEVSGLTDQAGAFARVLAGSFDELHVTLAGIADYPVYTYGGPTDAPVERFLAAGLPADLPGALEFMDMHIDDGGDAAEAQIVALAMLTGDVVERDVRGARVPCPASRSWGGGWPACATSRDSPWS